MTGLPPQYRLVPGSGVDRALLVQYMQRTYAELFPGGTYAHLATVVDQYFSRETPLWWVESDGGADLETGLIPQPRRQPLGCLWLGNAIDQVQGDRHTHIFLLYVVPEQRRRGLGTALVGQAEAWARARGDRQIGLQVFQSNQPALNLYQRLGYQAQSLWMVKSLQDG